MRTFLVEKLLFLAIICFLFANCKKDDGIAGCSDNFILSTALENELNDISTATNAYIMDQSAANCDALKQAYEDYLDAAEDLKDCAISVGQGVEYQQAIDDARDSLNDFVC